MDRMLVHCIFPVTGRNYVMICIINESGSNPVDPGNPLEVVRTQVTRLSLRSAESSAKAQQAHVSVCHISLTGNWFCFSQYACVLQIALPTSAAVFFCLCQGKNSKHNTLSNTVGALQVSFSPDPGKSTCHVSVVLMYRGFTRSALKCCLQEGQTCAL